MTGGGWAGPPFPKLLIIGEAWGQQEDMMKKPFVGFAGQELFRMLGEAMPEAEPELHAEATRAMRYGAAWTRVRDLWLNSTNIAMTNVLNLRPPSNNLEHLCDKKKDLPSGYKLSPLSQGKYLRVEFLPELGRLYGQIATAKPNLILACGNTACWATLAATNIGSIRGAVAHARYQPGIVPSPQTKVLPTYHPAGVMRNWAWRPIVVADLMKASREMAYPEIIRPRRSILINPTLEELWNWTLTTLASRPELLSVDIETGAGQIKCIGFAASTESAIVIPFVDLNHPSGSYWPTPAAELSAWTAVRALLESGTPILGQNFVYDLQYILKTGIRPANCIQDTMLLHHSIYPELMKGLGFLGSIYTSESSWKLMRRPKADTEKRDE